MVKSKFRREMRLSVETTRHGLGVLWVVVNCVNGVTVCIDGVSLSWLSVVPEAEPWLCCPGPSVGLIHSGPWEKKLRQG